MQKKLKQYHGLVENAESQGCDCLKTTSEDLQGFWDMLYFQVEDVLTKFKYLEELECNAWQDTFQKTLSEKVRRGKVRWSIGGFELIEGTVLH